MERALSKRVGRCEPSATLAVSATARRLRAAGQEIIDWSAGEPDFDTPENICDAAIQAIRDGQTRYTSVGGTPALRAAIAHKFHRDNKLHFEADQILVSAGAKQALYNCFQALVDPGDEVIIPVPYWASYPDMVRLAGGEPVFLPTTLKQNFRPTAEQLDQAISPRTKLLILNSPSNPCGAMLHREDLEGFARVLRAHPHVRVASDDIYELIRFDGVPFCNLVQVAPDLSDRVLLINGVSKAYAMTGWRIGYAAGPKDIIDAMLTVQSQSTSNPCSVAQAAACAALLEDQSSVPDMVAAFEQRRNYIVTALNELPGITCLKPDGAFYCLPDVGEAMRRLECPSDIEFATLLLDQLRLAVVPGIPFGSADHIRVSFATDMPTLEEGISRLRDLLD